MSTVRLVVVLATVTAVLGLAGCTASGAVTVDTANPGATAVLAPVPQGAATLAQLGVRNGPGHLTLPQTVQLSHVVDQPNLVTLVIDPTDGARVQEHLSVQVPLEGGAVIARSEDALVFSIQGWDGAYTFNDQQAALALRRSG